MTGFGRKGLDQQSIQSTPAHTGVEALRNAGRGPFRPQAGGGTAPPRVGAFVAAERARNAEQARGIRGSGEAGLSDVAASYRSMAAPPTRPLWVAYLLWFFFGQFSAHRFYLGAYRSAIAQVGLFAAVIVLAFGASKESYSTVGPVMILFIVVWALWVFGDVFFIHRIHRNLCRDPGELASAFA